RTSARSSATTSIIIQSSQPSRTTRSQTRWRSRTSRRRWRNRRSRNGPAANRGMTGRRVHTALLGIVLAIVGVGPAVAQDEPRVSFSTSVDYSVGDYGTGKDTTLLYVPFTLGVRPFDGLWLNVTVPYLYQTGQNIVLTGGGVAVKGKKSN